MIGTKVYKIWKVGRCHTKNRNENSWKWKM